MHFYEFAKNHFVVSIKIPRLCKGPLPHHKVTQKCCLLVPGIEIYSSLQQTPKQTAGKHVAHHLYDHSHLKE